jgi:hypothetical protein
MVEHRGLATEEKMETVVWIRSKGQDGPVCVILGDPKRKASSWHRVLSVIVTCAVVIALFAVVTLGNPQQGQTLGHLLGGFLGGVVGTP